MYKKQFIFLKSLVSSKNEKVAKETEDFLNELRYRSIPFKGNIFFIETGGSEEIFLHIYQNYEPPYHIIATNMNNSLPSALEIVSFLKEKNIPCFLYQGKPNEVRDALLNQKDNDSSKTYPLKKKIKLLFGKRIGVVGKPSDWLIASEVNYKRVKDVFNVSIIDIPFSDLLEGISEASIDDIGEFKEKLNSIIDEEEMIKALKIYKALKEIISKYKLDALTVRCFDLLNRVHSTGCIALALLNSEGIPSSCEGDVPSLLSMMIIKQLFNKPSFQCNPSYFNRNDNTAYLAHCTLPLDMCNDYSLDTHFESGIGVGIHGELKEGNITIFKINAKMDKFVVYAGEIVKNMYKTNLCRTQIKVYLKDGVANLISSPLGNHLLVVYGDRKDEILKALVSKMLSSKN